MTKKLGAWNKKKSIPNFNNGAHGIMEPIPAYWSDVREIPWMDGRFKIDKIVK